ncbi:MAG: protein-disulfide reductase DsbD domain-containing protein [Pirellulaceae bacterium]
MLLSRSALLSLCSLLWLAAAPLLAEDEPLLKSDFGTKPAFPGIPGLESSPSNGDVEVSASYKIKRGKNEGELVVRAEITPGWHTFSLTMNKGATGKPSALKIESADIIFPKKLESGEPEFDAFPPPTKKQDEFSEFQIEEHEDQVTWTTPIQLKVGVDPEKAKVKVTYSGQVCSTSCIGVKPKSMVAVFGGFIEPPTGEFHPSNNEMVWKAHLEPKVVVPGGKARLVFEATPTNGYHFYPQAYVVPEVDGPFPTLVVVTNSGGWRNHAVQASAPPRTVTEDGETQTYYDEPTTFSVELDVPKSASPGEVPLSGVLGYMTCKKTCNFPGGAKFTVVAKIGAVEEPGKVLVAFEEFASGGDVKKIAKATPLPYGVIDYKILIAQLGLALIGGILLNFMPCVLPVLGLKILNFAQQGGKSRGRVLALNVVYTAGLIAVFLVLATMSAFLNFGWGQQFTQMWFKLTLIVMTFAFAISFLGVWEIPIPGFAGGEKANSLQQQEGYFGAFFKGVFTTVLGVSCSGPFLGGVFGYTLTQPPLITYLIFICVAVGMASPFLIIALLPQTQKLLPKPGEWMNTFKHLMGFVMLGVVVYLFSTLGKDYYVATLAMLTGVGFGLWWIGRVPAYEETGKQAWAWGIGLASAALIGFLSFQYLGPVTRLYDWKHFSQAELTSLQKEDKTVMVDFTASWCLNCQVNFRYAINTSAVKEAVEKNGVIAIEADWTEPNKELEAKLAELNSQSIPILAIYPAGRPQDVIILRDLVTAKQVVEALEKAGPSKDAAKGEGTATAEAGTKKPRAG